MNAPIYDGSREGPFSPEEAQIKTEADNNRHCLYQIYGDHPCHGHDVPPRTGQTSRGVGERFRLHKERFSAQCEEVKVFIASCGRFTTRASREQARSYSLPERTILHAIEALLICTHQPAYNSREKGRATFAGENLRVFSTGRRKARVPEISTLFYRDNARSDGSHTLSPFHL